LGFIDPEIHLDALEVTHHIGMKEARLKYPELSGYPFIESSDAHFIDDIGHGVTTIFLERGTISELRMAFRHHGGRYIQEK
jgi:PHP family Zn ribbon phosphoesterase